MYFSNAKEIKKALQSDALITSIVDHIEVTKKADIRVSLGAIISISDVPYLDGVEAIWIIKLYGVLDSDLEILKQAITAKIGGEWSSTTLELKQYATQELIDYIQEKQDYYVQREQIFDAVKYATSLTSGKDGLPGIPGPAGKDGLPGPPGRDGKDGRDGRDGLDLLATETKLEDLKDVDFGTLELSKGQVLTWDGTEWTNRYVPQLLHSRAGVPKDLFIESVAFDTTLNVAPTLGQLRWAPDEGTLALGFSATVYAHIGQDIYSLVRNQTGATIPKGRAVMFAGTLGASGRIKVAPMVANGTYPGYVFFGITDEDIPNGSDGYVLSYGKLKQLNTSGYPEGSILWCDPANPGGLTATEPSAPNLKLPVAAVISSKNNGTLMVRWDTGRAIKDLHDVEVSSTKQDGDALKWNAINNRWEAKSSVNVQASGQITIEALSNTQLVVRYKGTDNVTRSTTLTLTA